MRLLIWSMLALAIAHPLGAQEVEPGLTIVGHGPDVPNVSSTPTCDVGQAVCSLPQAAEPPALIILVPVPILVPSSRPHHGRPAASSTALIAPSQAAGRFVNDPSNRFVNDPSHRFLNDPSNRFVNDPSNRFMNSPVRPGGPNP